MSVLPLRGTFPSSHRRFAYLGAKVYGKVSLILCLERSLALSRFFLALVPAAAFLFFYPPAPLFFSNLGLRVRPPPTRSRYPFPQEKSGERPSTSDASKTVPPHIYLRIFVDTMVSFLQRNYPSPEPPRRRDLLQVISP